MSWLSELFFWTGGCSFGVNVRNRYRFRDRVRESESLGNFIRNNLDSFCWDYL